MHVHGLSRPKGFPDACGDAEWGFTSLQLRVVVFNKSLEIGAKKLDEHVDGFGGPRGLLGDAPVAPVVTFQRKNPRRKKAD